MAANKLWKTAPAQVVKIVKPILHWGFVPLIMYIAIKQEPGLTVLQIINPFAAPAEPMM